MSPQGTSSPSPNKAAGRRNKGNITHSQKRLENLTEVAVERAYKLHTESRRVVHIVETHSCGNSKSFGCSRPLSSLTSALQLKSSSPSSSRNWDLPKDSNDRRSVAARIHTLLNQWRADSSFDWRARVALVVPVLEEVVYKEAKSQEEYTNPQLLESQLMNVLCHFEAGNGPFLLQGSTPLYPVRACYRPSSSSHTMSPLWQSALSEGVPANGIAPEEAHERARLTCTQSSASDSSPISTEAVASRQEAEDTFQNMCDTKVSTSKHGGHAISSKIVKKVASMLSKKRREKSECLQEELEREDQGAEAVERLDTCHGNGRMRRTLGGMLKLDMLNMKSSEAAPLASSTTTKNTLVLHTEEANATPCDMVGNAGAEASDLGCILDSQTAEVGSLVEIFRADLGQGACKSISLSSSTSTPAPQPRPSSSFSSSSSSSTSASPPRRSMSYSPSSFSPSLSASAPSPSLLTLPHQAPLSLPSPPCSTSSSPPPERFTHTSIACLKPLPQHQPSSFSQQPAPVSASSDVSSVQINYLICEDHQNGALNDGTEALLQSCQVTEPAAQIAFEHSTTRTAPEEHREVERGESSLTSSITSSPSGSNEEVSKRRDKGVKLPLSSFLAEREEYLGCISSYEEGGPWDTWEEATEQLDGMCCVCMVGFKGAAFIPCGHTFCRKCTRELWKGRGTCPLCNRYIREILDIY